MIVRRVVLLALAAGAAPQATFGQAGFEAAMQREVNAVRRREGIAALGLDARLTGAAEAHAADLARNGAQLAHRGSDGSQVSDRVTRQGYAWRTVAENISFGRDDPRAVVIAWLNSPGHRANLLRAGVTQMGAALTYRGESPYRHYAVLVLAAPR
jgi:uncharacterized protein YkwD